MNFKLSSIAAAVILSNASFTALTASADDADADGIERITIDGQYLSMNESNSVKSPTPIIDVPQSLSIITADDITLRGFNSVGQIIDYTPGVNTSQGEGHRDAVVFRGIRSTADFYMDGNRDDVQYYRALYNVEQVEILRGPNALLFGRGGTGGILNRVSKKAEVGQEFSEYQVSLNSFGAYSGQIDTNLNTGENYAIRINAMYEHLDNHRDFYDGDRYGFNPTSRIQLGDDTTVDLSYEYINHERFIDRGIPTSNGLNGRPVEAYEDITFGDPQNNYHELEAHVFRANVEHRFSDNLKGNFNAFYGDYDKVYANYYPSDFDEANNLVELDGYIDTTQRDNLILSANLVGEYQTGSIGHTLIFGGEYIETGSNQDRFNPVWSSNNDDQEWFDITRPLNLNGFNGVNAQGVAVSGPFTDLNDDTHVNLDVFSFYIQDEIEISENLDIVIGARYDSFDIDVDSFGRTGDPLNNVNGDVVFLDNDSRKDDQVSPRAGIIYKPQENISIYASYSESFLPRSGEQYANIGGNAALDPDTFKNREIGIKYDFAEGLSFTAAIFQNEQSTPEVDNNDPERFVVVDRDIEGFEMQLFGAVTDDWSINANFSYLDGEIVNQDGPTGITPRELPENTFSVWNNYQVAEEWGVGLGMTYQSESFTTNSLGSSVLPSYTRFDAAAFYDVSDTMRVQLNVENLTDKLYFPNAHSTHQATVAQPLNARITLIGSF